MHTFQLIYSLVDLCSLTIKSKIGQKTEVHVAEARRCCKQKIKIKNAFCSTILKANKKKKRRQTQYQATQRFLTKKV